MSSLSLQVITPSGVVVPEQPVDEVTVPGQLGEFGVLPGHIALLSAISGGVLSYRSGGQRGRLALGAGFAEVDGKGAVIALCKKAVRSEKIDREAAERLLREAESKLGKGDEAKAGLSPAERELALEDRAWAQAQLDALRA
jgi:F-type H+-transporting ATPase subunit epsilon